MRRAGQIATGNIDLNDADWLRADPAMVASLGRLPVNGRPGASQETIGRFESNAISKENTESVKNLLIDHYLKRHKNRPQKIELDIDGMMFIGDWLVAATLRLVDQGESSTVLPELKEIVVRLRQRWANVKIIVRMDAALASAEPLRWLRQERIGYQLGLRPNSVLTQFAKQYMEEAEQKSIACSSVPCHSPLKRTQG